MNRFRHIILFIIVIAIAATSSWLLRKIDPEPFNILKPVQHNMDYFLTDFDAAIMDKSGNPHYALKGKRLEHFPDDNSIDVIQPDIKLFRDKLPPWQIKSDFARILNKGSIIHLNGNVFMTRPKSKNEPEIKLNTSNLTIDVSRNFAETKNNVHIYSKKHNIKAKGMRVYTAEGRVELLSNVTGVFDAK